MRWRRGASRNDVIDVRGGGGGAGGFNIPAGFESSARAPSGEPIPASQDPDRDLADFSVYVFNNAQATWERIFSQQGETYDRAKLVLYRQGVDTACGSASSSVGPFYCPADRYVYLDLSFYRDMERQLRAGGEFAWAYVIAHEVGHHVQEVVGTSDEVNLIRQRDPDQAIEASVRLGLQADCY